MAKKKKSHRSRGFTIPLAPIGGLYVGIASPFLANDPVGKLISGDYQGGVKDMAQRLAGQDNNGFRLDILMRTYLPIVLGLLIHKFVGGSLGLNRMLARAKVPFVRV